MWHWRLPKHKQGMLRNQHAAHSTKKIARKSLHCWAATLTTVPERATLTQVYVDVCMLSVHAHVHADVLTCAHTSPRTHKNMRMHMRMRMCMHMRATHQWLSTNASAVFCGEPVHSMVICAAAARLMPITSSPPPDSRATFGFERSLGERVKSRSSSSSSGRPHTN